MVAEKKGSTERMFWLTLVIGMSTPYFIAFPSFVEKLGLVVTVLQYIVIYMPHFYLLIRHLLSFRSQPTKKRIMYAIIFSALLVTAGLLEARLVTVSQVAVIITSYSGIMAVLLPTIEFLVTKLKNKRR